MVSEDSLLQANATIIAGLLIFLTISTTVTVPITLERYQESRELDSSSNELIENTNNALDMMIQQSNSINMIAKSYLSIGYQFTSLVTFFILMLPFVISTICILMNKGKPKRWMAGGLVILLISLLGYIFMHYSFYQLQENELMSSQKSFDSSVKKFDSLVQQMNKSLQEYAMNPK